MGALYHTSTVVPRRKHVAGEFTLTLRVVRVPPTVITVDRKQTAGNIQKGGCYDEGRTNW